MSAAPTIAHPSATLALLRDGPDGLEVLMLRRHEATDFSGALVFPGGRVDADDASAELAAHCRVVPGLDPAALACRIAAVRESYEELHVLVARRAGEEALIAAAALRTLEDETAARGGQPTHLANLVSGSAIELAVDCLVPFARWVTPTYALRRYDTHFFLAPAPAGQEVRPDGREAVSARWITPAMAIAEADARRERLVFATRMNLMRLAKSGDVATALADAARRADRIAAICPEVRQTPAGNFIRIPPGCGLDLGYDDCELPMTPRASSP